MVLLPPFLLKLGVVTSTVLAVSATVFTSNSSIAYNATYLSAEAWHAQSLTQVSWDLQQGEPSAIEAHHRDRMLVFFDALGTNLLRFGSTDDTSQSTSSSSSSSSSSPLADYIAFPDDMGTGTDVCAYDAYVVDPSRPFNNNALSQNGTAELQNSSAWWYTSTLGQLAEKTTAGDASGLGSVSILLGDPGAYFVCLVLGEEDCIAKDCLEIRVYQPPNDFLEVGSP